MIDINDWISVSQISGGSGTNQITITVEENKVLEDRTHSLKVIIEGKEAFINVQQKAFNPSLTTDKQVVAFTQDVLTQSLQITSNCEWVASCDSWITLNQTEGNKGTTTIILNVSANESKQDRYGSIMFYYNNILLGTVNVTQEGIDYLDVSTNEIILNSELTATIDVSSNKLWTIETDVDWLTFSPNEGKEAQVSIIAEEDDGLGREAIINILIDGVIKHKITLYQVGVVEVPNDVEDCFYVEPFNKSTIVTFYKTLNVNNTDEELYYYHKGEWKVLYVKKNGVVGELNIYRRVYMKDFNRSVTKITYGWNYTQLRFTRAIVGGNIETLLGEMKKYYALHLFGGVKLTDGVSDASNLILPSNNLSPYCYYGMFYENPLINSPILKAETLADNSYCSMFEFCDKLKNITMLATDISANDCLRYWVNGVSSTGTFTKKQGVEIPSGDDGIPDGWTVVEVP